MAEVAVYVEMSIDQKVTADKLTGLLAKMAKFAPLGYAAMRRVGSLPTIVVEVTFRTKTGYKPAVGDLADAFMAAAPKTVKSWKRVTAAAFQAKRTKPKSSNLVYSSLGYDEVDY